MLNKEKFNKETLIVLGHVMKRLSRVEHQLKLDHLSSVSNTKEIDHLQKLAKLDNIK